MSENDKNKLPKPDHYYPLDDNTELVPVDEFEDPDDEQYVCKGVPVFKPSMDEFEDFYGYVNKIDRYGMQAGIVKVIPPQEWIDRLPKYDMDNLESIKIRQPIAQHMLGRSGLYKQTNVVKRRIMGVDQWANLSGIGPKNKFQFRAPAPKSLNENSEQGTGRVTRSRGGSSKTKETVKERNRRLKNEKLFNLQNEVKDEVKTENDVSDIKIEPSQAEDFMKPSTSDYNLDNSIVKSEYDLDSFSINDDNDLLKRASTVSDVSDKPKRKKRKSDFSQFYDNLDIKNVWLPDGASHDDYNTDGCKYLEKIYWRTLGLGDNEVSWYGADLSGSLFTDDIKSWNVANLPSYLTDLLRDSGSGLVLPGVNTPYLYFGTWRATFAWHVEDMDLYSINYIHFGAPKYWYTIPQKYKQKFEQVMATLFPGESRECPEWLRHKSYLASPSVLASHNLKPSVLVQHQNEFVITFPHGYHSGFNMGFNCAESVNFATERWTEYGRKARACTCIGDSVRINVDQILEQIELRKNAMEAEKNEGVLKVTINKSSLPHSSQIDLTQSLPTKLNKNLPHASTEELHQSLYQNSHVLPQSLTRKAPQSEYYSQSQQQFPFNNNQLPTYYPSNTGYLQNENSTHLLLNGVNFPLIAPRYELQVGWLKWAANQNSLMQHIIIQVPWMKHLVEKNTTKREYYQQQKRQQRQQQLLQQKQQEEQYKEELKQEQQRLINEIQSQAEFQQSSQLNDLNQLSELLTSSQMTSLTQNQSDQFTFQQPYDDQLQSTTPSTTFNPQSYSDLAVLPPLLTHPINSQQYNSNLDLHSAVSTASTSSNLMNDYLNN